jgi:hypothetical protein
MGQMDVGSGPNWFSGADHIFFKKMLFFFFFFFVFFFFPVLTTRGASDAGGGTVSSTSSGGGSHSDQGSARPRGRKNTLIASERWGVWWIYFERKKMLVH